MLQTPNATASGAEPPAPQGTASAVGIGAVAAHAGARPDHPGWPRWLWTALGLALLAAVFLLYLRPGFLVMLADAVWACF